MAVSTFLKLSLAYKLIGRASTTPQETFCLCSWNSMFWREYRSHRTHNIGRLHGLEKQKQPEVPKKLQGVWNPTKHESSLLNHYSSLNFTVSGYDMVLVESFAKLVHQRMIKHSLKNIEVYALPTNEIEVKKMNQAHQRKLDDMDSDIMLKFYKRVIQVTNMPSNVFPLLMQSLVHNIPQSVHLDIDHHSEEKHNMRLQRRLELESEKEALAKLYALK